MPRAVIHAPSTPRQLGEKARAAAAGHKAVLLNVGMRTAASGPGWSERFLNLEDASRSTPAESLALGHSVVVISPELLALSEECEVLREEASAQAAAERQRLSSSTLWNFEGSPGVERVRLPVVEHLSDAGLALCDAMLLRGCAVAGAQWPELISDLFPGDPDALENNGCLDGRFGFCLNEHLGFSLKEPAVNVYQAGGRFKPHKDNQRLTILITLSDPEAFGGKNDRLRIENVGSVLQL